MPTSQSLKSESISPDSLLSGSCLSLRVRWLSAGSLSAVFSRVLDWEKCTTTKKIIKPKNPKKGNVSAPRSVLLFLSKYNWLHNPVTHESSPLCLLSAWLPEGAFWIGWLVIWWNLACLSLFSLAHFISVYILLKAVFYLAERALFGLDISYGSLSLLYGLLAASLNKW